MKKLAMLFVASLLLGGAVFAKDENGALGLGILSESKQNAIVSGTLRGNLFLDVGYQLAGPLFYGFEFQGDVKKMGQDQFSVNNTDATAYDLGGGDYLLFISNNNWTSTYTLWDLDFSPRGYISFDLGDKIQLLGFGGFNYNWQTLDLEVKMNSGSKVIDGKTYTAGTSNDTYQDSQSVGNGYWSIVAGFRVSVGAFYVDYTRFLDDSKSQVSWNQFNKDRLGLGINLRF